MEDGQRRPKKTNYGVCAFWCLMVLLLVIAGLVFAIVYLTVIDKNIEADEIEKDHHDKDGKEPTSNPDSGVCDNPNCVTLASSLIERMNPTVDPCHDFYDYACGNWLKNTIIPAGKNHARTFDKERQRHLDLKVLFEAPEQPGEQDAIKKAKTVYRSCMDKATREEKGLTVIQDGAQDYGGWPILENNRGGFFNAAAFDLTSLTTGLFSGTGCTSIINAKVKNTDNGFKLEISAGTLTGLPSEEYLTESKYSVERDAYLKYMTDAALAFGAHPDVAGPEMEAVLNLEKQLAQAKLESEPTPKKLMTVGEMKAIHPEFYWDAFLAFVIPQSIANVTDDFEVINADSEYLSKALMILKSEPPRLVADWMIWLCFDDAMLYLNDEVRNIYYEFQSAVQGIAPKEYYEDCVDFTSNEFRGAAERLYTENYYSPEAWSMIRELADEVKITLDRLAMKNMPFEDEMITNKLENMTIAVGLGPLDDKRLDEEYEDHVLRFDGVDIFENFLTASIFKINQNIALLNESTPEYARQQDKAQFFGKGIHISPNDARPPTFNKDWPMLMNYANLGMLIPRELVANIQPAENIKAEKSSCIQQQYDTFMLPESGQQQLAAIDSIIADNAGIEVAVEVLMKKIIGGFESSLSGLDLTTGQLFFLQNAQLWCEKYSPEYEKRLEGKTPAKFRVNGMLQNSAAFSEVFNCPAGRDMNPENKCVVL